MKCLESEFELRENRSKICSFSYISHSLDLRPSLTGTTETGLFAMARSQILTARKSLEARYFSFLVKFMAEMLDTISVKKFFGVVDSCWKFTAVLSQTAE